MGPGTLAVLIGIIVGIIIYIFGLAFQSPGLFVFIGVLIPILIFIICISLPTKDDEKTTGKVKILIMIIMWLRDRFILL